eukprot:gene1688-1844_t
MKKTMDHLPLHIDRKSYLPICFLYVLHGLAFTILIPALPLLTLRVSGGDAAKSSLIYGFASFLRYVLEFFSAPALGTVADVKGRKVVLLGSFFISAVEFFLLAAFPSISMVFVTRALSGLGDAGVATSYSIVTDLAIYNGDVISQQYSLLAAMTGIAYIIGPFIGGALCEINIQLCFVVAAIVASLGGLACWYGLEESVHYRSYGLGPNAATKETSTESSLNPFVGLRIHMSNPRLRQYVFPLFLCTMNAGMSFLWYLYLHARFNATPSEIGAFLSFHGLVNAFVLGFLVQHIIPTYLTERDATVIFVLLAAVDMMLNAWAREEYELYIITLCFGMGAAYLPAFKSVIVNDSLEHKSGTAHLANLQGFISSIRTMGTALGALLYSSLFSLGMHLKPIIFPQLAFLVASAVYLIAWFYLRIVFITAEEEKNMVDANSGDLTREEELHGLLADDVQLGSLGGKHMSEQSKSYDALHAFEQHTALDETEFLS